MSDDLIGQRLGQYEIIDEVGMGGMATVYRAFQTSINRNVAIKVLPTQFARDENFVKRFHAEAQAIAALEHVHILPLYDFGTQGGYTYMVMRYITGGTLEDIMGQPMSPERVVKIVGDIARALDYAHQQGVVHRDIKPSNVLIDEHGEPLLTDFGIAKMLEGTDATRLTGTGTVLGTPDYMAPEQAENVEIDGRADIYSLGVVLYELLTGQPPFQAKTPLAVVMMHVRDPLPMPRTINPDIPESLEQVVVKAMAKDPNDRYQTAGEMADALQQALKQSDGAPVAAVGATESRTPSGQGHNMTAPMRTTPTAAQPEIKSGSGGKTGLIAAVVIILLLLGGGGIAYFSGLFGGQTPTPEPVAVIEPTSTPTPEPSLTPTEAPTDTPTPQPTNTPTSQPSATNTAPSEPTATDTPAPQATPTPSPLLAIAPSSLVGTIAYPVFNGTTYDIYFGLPDGSGTQFFQGSASQPAFSPDGSRIAFHSWLADQRGIMTTDVGGGNQALVSTFIEDQLPTWTADSSAIILLSRRSGDRKSELFRADSTVDRGENSYIGEGEYPTVGPNNQLFFKGWGVTGFGLRTATINFENIQPITDVQDDTAPAISPNGQTIAFMTRRDENWEIYTINIDGSGLTRLTDNPADDGLPTWSPDGTVLAFASNRDGGWAVWGMTAAGNDLQKLFDMEGSPDGFVETDPNASRGWAEERMSWTP